MKIIHGRVIDGAGNPWFQGDVGVTDGRIADVGDLRRESAQRTIDAHGLFVSPGFIDMHSHSDLQLLIHPDHEPKVRQGVTLDVLGQDGLSYAPNDDSVLDQLRVQLAGWNDNPPEFQWNWRTVAEYLARFDNAVAINVAYLIPHSTVRMCVMGMDNRPPTSSEIQQMQTLVREGLEQGAVGLSSGLSYAPGMYALDQELVELCRVMAGTGGYYAPHHRNYGLYAFEAYRDCIKIGQEAQVPVHLTHAHLGFPVNKGRAGELLDMVDDARSSGVDVTMDTYPYTAGCTYLHAYFPGWVNVGGVSTTVKHLADMELRERIRAEMEDEGCDGFFYIPMDWSYLSIGSVHQQHNRRWLGKTILDAARVAGKRPIDFACDLLVEEELGVMIVSHIGNEDNVRQIMTHPAHMAGSDGILVGDRPHPRGWGTYPRYLAEYVRELGILTWEDAIRKMTSLPAQRLGLRDRGLLSPGMAADIVCFDPATVQDNATYENPRQFPTGIPFVLVNGVVVVDEGQHTGRLPGRAVKRQDTFLHQRSALS